MKITKKLATIATFALAAFAAASPAKAADTAGHIVSIEPVNYKSGTKLGVGEKVQILVRMLNEDWEGTKLDSTANPAKTWYFISVGATSTNLASALNRPQLGLSIGGRIAYAEYVDSVGEYSSGANPQYPYYTDLYFEYTIKPGDLGLPIKLLNSEKKVADDETSTDSHDYCLLNANTKGKNWGAYWTLSNVDGDVAGFHYRDTSGLAALDVPEKPNGHTEHVLDIYLGGANICVQTIDFDEVYSTEDPTAWRDVYPSITDNVATAPRIIGQGGANGAIVYVWSDNPDVFEPYSADSADYVTVNGTNCLKITIAPGAEETIFRLKGGTAAVGTTANIYMSSQPLGETDKVDDTLESSIVTRKIRMVAAPPPSIRLTFNDEASPYAEKVDALTKSPIDFTQEDRVELTITLSEAYSSPVEIHLRPVYVANPEIDLFASNYLAIATSDSPTTDYRNFDTNVTITSGRSTVVYLYPLGGDLGTASEGIKFEPVINDPAVNDHYSEKIGCTLRINDVKPSILSPTSEDSLLADKKTGCPISIEVSDTYRDLNKPQTYDVEVIWDVGTTFTTKGVSFRNGIPTQITATGFSSSATKAKIKVTDPQGNSAQTDYVPITVAATKKIYAELVDSLSLTAPAITDLQFGENSPAKYLRFRVEPESAANTARMYAFLVPLNEASSNLVTSAAFTEGVTIEGESAVAIATTPAALKFLDGCDKTADLRYGIMLRTEPTLTGGTEILDYEPQTLLFSVTNTPARVAGVTYNGGTVIQPGAVITVPDGIPVTFVSSLVDDSAIDLTNKVTQMKCAWAVTNPDNYTKTVEQSTSTGNDTYKYTFNGEGDTYTVAVYAKDKDYVSGDVPRFEFTVKVAAKPYIYFTSVQKGEAVDTLYITEEATAKERWLYLNLSQSADTALDVEITAEQIGDGGNVKFSKTLVTFAEGVRTGTTSHRIIMSELDGYADDCSIWIISAKVVNPDSSVNSDGVAWNTIYSSRDLELTIANVPPSIKRYTPGNSMTNSPSLYSEQEFVIWASDCEIDLAGDMVVTWIDSSGNTHYRDLFQDGSDWKCCFTNQFVREKDQQVSVQLTDKDSGESQKIVWNFLVAPTKRVQVTAFGPAGSSQTKYATAAGLGKGRVWADASRTVVTSFRHTYFLDVTESQAGLYAYGYPAAASAAGYKDDGTLTDANAETGRDIAISVSGRNATETYKITSYYTYGVTSPAIENEWMYDNFFYCWVDVSSTPGLTAAVNGVPKPTVKSHVETYADVTLDPYEADKESYEVRNIEAVFSREYLVSDNMGDINGDGIPDLYVAGYMLDGDVNAVPATDLVKKDALNDDADYLFASLTSLQSSLIPGLPATWEIEGYPFSAKLEIRGYGEHLNDAPSICGVIRGAKPDKVYTDPDTDPKSTLTKAEYLAFIETGLTPEEWSPERPTDPTKEDTDEDGFPDGYEYYYWYRAHVGWVDFAGNHVYLTGERYDPMNPGEPEIITANEIKAAFDPIVPVDLVTIDIRDTDNDGLVDRLEFELGTNPFHWDTDGDGLPDGYEVMLSARDTAATDPLMYATSPGIADTLRNFDNDYMASVVVKAKDKKVVVFGNENGHYCAWGNYLGMNIVQFASMLDVTNKFYSAPITGNVVRLRSGLVVCTTRDVTTYTSDDGYGKSVERLKGDLLAENTWVYTTHSPTGDDKDAIAIVGMPRYVKSGAILATNVETGVEFDKLVLYTSKRDEYGERTGEPWELAGKLSERVYHVWKYGIGVADTDLYGIWAMSGDADLRNGTVILDPPKWATVARQHYISYAGDGFDPRTAWKGEGSVNTRSYNDYDEFLVCSFFLRNGESGREVWRAIGDTEETRGYYIDEQCALELLVDFRVEGDSTYQSIWAANCTNPYDADSDRDKVPDGWELYVMGGRQRTFTNPPAGPFYPAAGPLAAMSPLWAGSGVETDNDGLPEDAEYAGSQSTLYAGAYALAEPVNPYWTNKRWPTDPWNKDTDDDGLSDGAEKDLFAYGEPAAPGAGGGLNPLSWDTDLDGLPDPFEAEFAGEYTPGESNTVTEETVGEDGTTNTVTTTVTGKGTWSGGMDGSVNDALADYDTDGLLNWQEYMVGAMRCWRYDDTISSWSSNSAIIEPYCEIPLPSDIGAWNKYWFERLVLGPYTITENPAENGREYEFNPHLVNGQFDGGNSYFSLCTNSWDSAVGKWYMFKDGIYHDLARPGPEWRTVYNMEEVQMNRFTWWIFQEIGMSPEESVGMVVPYKWGAIGGPAWFIYPTRYICCDPTKADTDNDGMDDYYEVFHGMNPLLGASDVTRTTGEPPYDVIFEAYAGRQPQPPAMWSAENNFWLNPIAGVTTSGSGATLARTPQSKNESTYDFIAYPWLTGVASADPDGDNIRNQNEAIMQGFQAASTFLHSDPTPLWMTDSSYTGSLTYRYYNRLASQFQADAYIVKLSPEYFEYDADGDGKIAVDKERWYFNSFPGYEWNAQNGDLTIMGYDPHEHWKPVDTLYSYEQNEGYDSDHDYLSDFEESQGKTKSASDSQSGDSPMRRQAMWFDGVNSFLQTPLATSETAPVTSLPGVAELPFLYFTVECWVKPEGDLARTQTILERPIWTGDANPGDENYLRRNFWVGIKNSRWSAAFDSAGTDAKQAVEISDGPVATTNWTHIAASYDGEMLRLYINGVCVKENTTSVKPEHGISAYSATPEGTLNVHSIPYEFISLLAGASASSMLGVVFDYELRISPTQQTTIDDYKNFYQGWIDEVRIWDGARTAAQILADFKKRYTREECLANRNEAYQAWRNYATFTEHSSVTRPAELRYHFSFDHLPGGVSTDGILKTPAGFTTAKGKTDSMAIWVRPDGWVNPWWDGVSQIASSVYDDRAWIPWINNTVTHLPRFDRTTLDSFYWSEDFAGIYPASYYGFASFLFPRTAEVVSHWIQMKYEEGEPWTTPTRLGVVLNSGKGDAYYNYTFTLRHALTEGGDMLPFGGAYPKRDTTLWDEQGAMDAWAETGLDADNNGLPDWWEQYARENYGVNPFDKIDWNTTVVYNGVSMTAWQAYLRDLAAGLLPSGEINPDYASVVDSDKDGLLDWWEDYWLVSKYSGDDDPDHDGLSNKQEWRVSEDVAGGFGTAKGYPALNPIRANSLDNQLVPDYFLRYDSSKNGDLFSKWYLGEIFADHDMLEDDDEKALGTDPTLYDAWSDKDEDGWTAWSEQRYSTFKMSIVARLLSHMNGEEEVIDSPIPVIHTTLRYNGEQTASGTNAAAIVVEAYSGNNLQKKPNATWRIVPGETEERHLYLGAWDRDKVFHGSLVPGHIFPGVNEMVIQYAFVQGSDNFSWEYNGRIFHGTYDEMLAAYTADPLNVFVSAAPFEWVDVYDGFVTNDLRSALQIAIDEKTQKGHFLIMNKKVGEIDAITGDFTLNLAQFEGLYMQATQVSLEQSVFRLKYKTRVPTTQTKALPVTLGKPDSGSLKEGNTALVAYMDLDGNGVYTPGEPLGIRKDLEIGWDQVPSLTIEMTDTSVAAGKRFEYDDTVETLRIIRTAINGSEVFEDGSEVKRRIVYSRNAADVERKTVYEGDLVTAGKFGLDWAGLRSDILAAGLQLKDVTDVTYMVVKNTASLEHIEEDNLLDMITVEFAAQQTKPSAVSPSVSSMGIVESQRPTFIWTGTDDNTAFMFKINDLAGNVVYSNDMQLLPPRDALGRYVWQAPVYIGTNVCADIWALNNSTSYTWQVAMFNAKYSSPLDAVWSDPATFSTALAASNDMTTDFGTAKVAVRYYGPATNTLDQVVVALFKNADFTGDPSAQSRLYDVEGAACDKLAVGFFEKAEGLYEINFTGLETGDYYAMAYIDRNGNMKRDRWETWGYANQIGLGLQAIYTPVAARVDADVAEVPYVTVYMEDTDVNQDDYPDCLTEDESILSAATKTTAAGADISDDDLDGLTADEETGDSYTEKAKWDTDGDGMPDGWEYKFADLDPLYPDAGTAAAGDAMAFAVEKGKCVYDASGASYLLMTTNDVTYRVGDFVTNSHLSTYYDYKTLAVSGTNIVTVTLCGVGTNLTGTAATFKIDRIEDVEVAYVHAQVYDRYGYSLKTAISQDGAVNTKPFTALDKYMVVRYLEAIGLAGEEAMNTGKTWKDFTLKPRDTDNDRDGIADGWELYVMFGTNGCGFVEGAGGTIEKATSLSQVKISPWNYADRELDLDGDGLTNVNENSDGNDPSDPWNQYSVYESLVAEGVIPPTTDKFDDKVRRFGIGESDLDGDWDLDQVSNGQEMWAYYIDYAKGSTLLEDIDPNNAWSDFFTPDYFRRTMDVSGAMNYLGAVYNGGEFIEREARVKLDIADLAMTGTRDLFQAGWDVWSIVRYSYAKSDEELASGVSEELSIANKYTYVMYGDQGYNGTTEEALVEFHNGTLRHEQCGSLAAIIEHHGGLEAMKQVIREKAANNLDADGFEVPEPTIKFTFLYTGNNQLDVTVDAWQTSSFYPERGEQLTASWALQPAFDAGVGYVEAKIAARGTIKQGKTRFIAYLDANGDGRLSPGETWGMADANVGYSGNEVTIRLGDANESLPVIQLASADTNETDRVIQTVAIVRTKINGEYVTPRGVMLRKYDNNVNRTFIYPLDYVGELEGETYIGIDRYLAAKPNSQIDPGDEDIAAVEEVTYEVVKLRRSFVNDDKISNTNLNHYTYTRTVIDAETGMESNIYYTVDQDVNEEFTVKYSITRDIPLEVKGEADSTVSDTTISFKIPTDRAVTKFWLEVNGFVYNEATGFILSRSVHGDVITGANGETSEYDSGRVILDADWFNENGVTFNAGEQTVRVALGNDKFPFSPDEDSEWSAEAVFSVAADAQRKGAMLAKVVHPLAPDADFAGKLTVAVYEKPDLAESVLVKTGLNAGETIELTGLRVDRGYYLAAWYVKDAEDGRDSAEERKPYDTWGYVASLGTATNGFNTAVIKAVDPAMSVMSTNVVYLQDTDWNDNGLLDRTESIKSVVGITPSEAPGWNTLDIDGDGIPDIEDDDPVFDGSENALEYDVMAYQVKPMLCVAIGTNENDSTWTWYIVYDTDLETNTLVLANGSLTIPRGTEASSLNSLRKTYLYGNKTTSPTGMGLPVTLSEGKVYASEYKDIVLVHAQVYDENGFNPLTANGYLGESGVNTKKFTSLDKYIVTNYLHAVGALPADTAWTNWVLSAKRIDFEYDGIPDGWELYVMSGPAGAGKLAAHSPWVFGDREHDADGDGLSQLNEYDAGNNPTDPWRGDTDGNGLNDYDTWKYALKGDGGLRRDNDNDQLSNFMEFMISSLDGFPVLDAGRMATYAEKFGGDQLVPDYFLRHGSLYLGEMFTDHDFIEDWFEDEQPVEVGATRLPNISRFRYDAAGDVDGDGWLNWAEARAEIASPAAYLYYVATNGNEVVTNVIETTEYALGGSRPTPQISFRMTYNGEKQVFDGMPVVVKAWRQDRSVQSDCDAKWYSNLVFSTQWPLTLGRPEEGYLRGGKNKFVVYVDFNGDGYYQPNEPYGVVENIDVDYAYGDSFVIELTDVNPSIMRVAIADAIGYQDTRVAELPVYDETYPQDQTVVEDVFRNMSAMYTDRGVIEKAWAGITHPMYVGTNTHIAASNSVLVRVVRSHINGKSGESYSDDAVLERVMSFRHGTVLTEADVLDDGVLDLDWGTLLPASGLAVSELADVSYRIVFIDPNVANNMENNNLAVAFINKFEKLAHQTPTVPIEVKASGSQPTFFWSHSNTIGKAYPAFQLRVWESDGKTLVYDSGALKAPARDNNGVYSWTAPLYDGMMTGEGKVFSTESDYIWGVSMLDAKYTIAADALLGKDTKKPFRLGGASAAGGLADYGLIPVAVKYMGPGDVSTTAAKNLIRVEAYTSPDFSGKPYGAAYVKHIDTLAASDVIELNAMVTGLPLGKSYYMLAYIDTNGNGVRDDWESWGYGNFVGTERKDVYTPRAYELAAKDVNDGTVPDCVIYIEDADTNDNKIPDVWEWNKDGKLGGASVTSGAQSVSPYIVTFTNGTSMTAVNLFVKLDGGAVSLPYYSMLTEMQNGKTLSSLSLALALAGIDNLDDIDVTPEVTITSFSLTDGITVKVDPKATIDGQTLKPSVVRIDVNLTLTLQYADSLASGWTDVKSITETFTLSSDATEIPADKLETMNTAIKSGISSSGTTGFYRIVVDVK